MKKTLIFALLVVLTATSTVMAQTKKKKKTPAKKPATTKIVTPKDTTPIVVQNPVMPPDTSKKLAIVPDSDDGYYKSVVMTKARPFPILEPDKNNIKFYHRYWRDIDLKDPKNQKFNTPGSTLIDALLQGMQDGRITPYDATPGNAANPTGDGFTVPLTYAQLMGKLRDTATVDKFDPATGAKIGSERKVNDFNANKIVGYRIKEDVYLDKRRERVETRIIGIAPLVRITLTSGDTVGTQPICWLKFKQCRLVFATMDLSDPDKNLYDVSMDDMFLQRQFNAKIIEESNPLGRRIKDYITDPIEQDKESARIEKKLADYKNNLWKYTTSETVSAAPAKGSKTPTPKKTPAAPPVSNSGGAPVKQ
ncbi:gliding motility protein GldN [Mucilaginibacter sp. HMF5004]|uniref:type IX secretion system ring protein PorN/GldN n=1 Tax=Mucilaginibacter rivuli TaxID=2857527 RepID=UPI001C5FAB51|nr:gliding motility protein GldN [Mucilaginibacter rivuli]MBW4889683.1 gliding motility protein GldN [Mucilaginibacter rivuli]